MSKNNMQSSMDSLISGLTIAPVSQTSSLKEDKGKESMSKERKTSEKHDYETFLGRYDSVTLEKARVIAATNGLAISDILRCALNDFVSRYENKYGEVRSKGKKRAEDLLK